LPIHYTHKAPKRIHKLAVVFTVALDDRYLAFPAHLAVTTEVVVGHSACAGLLCRCSLTGLKAGERAKLHMLGLVASRLVAGVHDPREVVFALLT
jgi:hypothetical protein